MILDTSALLAILQDEPERRTFNEAIEDAAVVRISAPTYVESSVVIEARFGAEGLRDLDRLLELASVEIVSFDAVQARAARDGFSRYGKGRHPASLNLGDCFSYALARVLGETLLYKGEDFDRTDVLGAVKAKQ
jgi:ribonuclease VapC